MKKLLLGSSCLPLILAGPVWAQERPHLDIDPSLLDAVLPSARAADELLTPLTLAERKPAKLAPAATHDVRPASDFIDNIANDLGDAFFFAPGVEVQALDINEPRIIIRGVGLGNRQERSSARLYRDGVPVTDVHGTTNAQEVDLLAVAGVEVLRGNGGDNRLVGGTLVGAVNLQSPTGETAPGLSARADAGSSIEGSPGGRLHARIGRQTADRKFDYFAALSGTYDQGFRDNNQRNSVILNANAGWRPTPRFSTRFFFTAMDNDTELAGGLFPDVAADDPSLATPAQVVGPLFPGGPIIPITSSIEASGAERDIVMGRVANQTRFDLLGHAFEAGFHYTYRDISNPQIENLGIIEQAGQEGSAHLAASNTLSLFGFNLDYRAGADFALGVQFFDSFENLAGTQGALIAETRQESSRINVFADTGSEIFSGLRVDLGSQILIAERDLTLINDGDDDAERRRFVGVTARGGISYQPIEGLTLRVLAARSYEPPSFTELLAADTDDLLGLDDEDAFTIEAGIDGAYGNWLGWSVTYFNTAIDGEILNVDDPATNGPGGDVTNVDATIHEGFEAAVDFRVAALGGDWTLRNAYSFSNFRFDTEAPFGDDDLAGNRLGGIAEHSYRGELRYTQADRWFVAATVRWLGGDFFADHANTLALDDILIVGLSGGLKLSERLNLFASAENLTDERFAAGLVPVVNQLDDPGQIVTPGERTSIFVGARYRF